MFTTWGVLRQELKENLMCFLFNLDKASSHLCVWKDHLEDCDAFDRNYNLFIDNKLQFLFHTMPCSFFVFLSLIM